jgi:outer membrane biosynthesis protein TonB
MNGIPEETANTQASAPAEQPKPAKKPHVAAHRAHVAPSQARSGKKATPAKKANKGATSAKSPKKATRARQGSKTAKVLDLLRRSGGASLKELRKATGWQAHSVRGFLSGALGKKMGLTVTSTKAEEGERRYSVKA